MYALVTGGNHGLGFYIAKELKNKNYKLIIIGKDEKSLQNAASLLNAEYYRVDLSKEYEKVGELIEKYAPEILINNAGFGLYGKFKYQNWKDLKNMISVNIIAVTYLTHKFLEVKNSGYILNIASVAACRKQPNLSVYAGTKSYVAQFTRSLAKELPSSIKISYLLLGPTNTNFFKRANMPTKGFEKLIMNPEKVAKYAVDKLLTGKTKIVPGLAYKLYCLGFF